MANIEQTSYDYSPVAIGDNEYETGVVTVPSGGLTRGLVVVRTSGKWVKGSATTVVAGAGLGILVEDYENSGSSATDLNRRVLIAGRVNVANVTVDGTALTEAQKDLLRANSIVPITVHQI